MILVLIILSLGMVGAKWVVLKMLPFDNKSEFQILVDMPEGTALERTTQVLGELGRYLQQVPEVRDYQAYAGISAPNNFNGLVRHSFYRSEPQQGDVAINLVPKVERDRSSHAIALDIRERIGKVKVPPGTSLKVVEPRPALVPLTLGGDDVLFRELSGVSAPVSGVSPLALSAGSSSVGRSMSGKG